MKLAWQRTVLPHVPCREIWYIGIQKAQHEQAEKLSKKYDCQLSEKSHYIECISSSNASVTGDCLSGYISPRAMYLAFILVTNDFSTSVLLATSQETKVTVICPPSHCCLTQQCLQLESSLSPHMCTCTCPGHRNPMAQLWGQSSSSHRNHPIVLLTKKRHVGRIRTNEFCFLSR